MRFINSLIVVLFLAVSVPATAQTITYEDLNFEDDSTSNVYKPSGKNYAFIKSKRGTEGMPKSPAVDSILSKQINEIVLVFTEVSADAMAEREDANEERWRNLLATYPQLFQFSTTYKSICQCKMNGSADAFKQTQGFYIYYAADEPKVKETKVTETKVAETKKESKEEKKVEDKKKNKKEKEEKAEETVKKEDKKKGKAKDKEKEKEKEPEKEAEASTGTGKEETVTVSEADFTKEKRKGFDKPKRAKDAKACRPPCYENGDEDLNNFFRDNINLSKKQKRHSKTLVSTVRIQLNFDGSIKKAMVTGTDEVLNQQVIAAVKMMNIWNPAVKAGLTVKSEVKLTLKYDKETKGMKPFETMINPRPGPKCKCASDAELGIE